MPFIIKRGDLWYKNFMPSGSDHLWTVKRDDAWRFTFRSVAQSIIDRDPRVAGAVVEEV